jgi:hypothetical protein
LGGCGAELAGMMGSNRIVGIGVVETPPAPMEDAYFE